MSAGLPHSSGPTPTSERENMVTLSSIKTVLSRTKMKNKDQNRVPSPGIRTYLFDMKDPDPESGVETNFT
jgi:hypothetical protein